MGVMASLVSLISWVSLVSRFHGVTSFVHGCRVFTGFVGIIVLLVSWVSCFYWFRRCDVSICFVGHGFTGFASVMVSLVSLFFSVCYGFIGFLAGVMV